MLVASVEEGIPLDTAAEVAGITYRTVMDWLAIGDGRQASWPGGHPVSEETKVQCNAFSQRIAGARAICEARMLREVLEYGQDDGKGRRDWRSRSWVFEHHPVFKERWAQHRELKVESTATVVVEQRLARQLPDSQLREVVGPEWAALLPPSVEGEVLRESSSMEGTAARDAAKRLPEGDTGPV